MPRGGQKGTKGSLRNSECGDLETHQGKKWGMVSNNSSESFRITKEARASRGEEALLRDGYVGPNHIHWDPVVATHLV